MKIFLTGAFGNIGLNVLNELVARGHKVRVFERLTDQNKHLADHFGKKIEVCWGDITNLGNVKAALFGFDCEAAIHLAAIIPPASEENPELAHKVNVEGTKNLLEAFEHRNRSTRFVFVSSASVFGQTNSKSAPRHADEMTNPSDYYSSQKVEAENLVKESNLDWVILRPGAVPPLTPYKIDRTLIKTMFSMPFENRIEFVHTRDVSMAIANSIENREISRKTLLIGGGKSCQMKMGDYINRQLEAFGVGSMPKEAFGKEDFHTDWLDTEESQRLLNYQQHSFDDYLKEVTTNLGWKATLARWFKPIIRSLMLRESENYRKQNKS